MKTIIPLIIILFASCNSCKTLNFTIKNTIQQNATSCASNGKCELKLIPNKKLIFKKDKFGMNYPKITDGENTLLTYTFKRNIDKATQDSNYTEIIYAVLPKTFTKMSLTNAELSKVNLHFARLCFCKGETGYYPIEKGNFKILKINKNTIKIACNFTIKNIPQTISSFEEVIPIKSN
jgi:hypothetical protein